MKPFRLLDYEGDDYAMHCSTYDDALTFLEFLDSHGRKWHSGDSYLSLDYWHDFKERSCYGFNDGSYGTLEEYTTVLNFEDFDWKELDYEPDTDESKVFMEFLYSFEGR